MSESDSDFDDLTDRFRRIQQRGGGVVDSSDSEDDIRHPYINPDITILSDGTDLTVSFGPRPHRNHSTPVDEREFELLQEGIDNLFREFLSKPLPLAFAPTLFRMSDTGKDDGAQPVAEEDLTDPENLAQAIKAISVNQVNTNKQIQSIVSIVNAMATEGNSRAKVFDVYTSGLEDYVKSNKEQMTQLTSFNEKLKEIHDRLDKRELERVKREAKKDLELRIKSDTFPDLNAPYKKDVGLETYMSYSLRVYSIVRSNGYPVEKPQVLNRVIDGILSGLSQNARSKTTTIRPDADGDYGYANLDDFMRDLRKSCCGDTVAASAAAIFMAKKQQKDQCLNVYLASLYNLWDIAYSNDNKSWQVLIDKAISCLHNEKLKWHLKTIEIPARKRLGQISYSSKGWTELKNCMIEVEATLRDAAAPSPTTYFPQQHQQQHNMSMSEPMETNAIGGGSSNNNGTRNKQQQHKRNFNSSNKGQRGSNSKANDSRNPPMNSQTRYRKAATEAEKKLKEQRKAEFRCFKCGVPCEGAPNSHYAKNCPMKNKQNNSSGSSSNMAATITQNEQSGNNQACAVGYDYWFADEGLSGDTSVLSIGELNDHFEQWADLWPTSNESDFVEVNSNNNNASPPSSPSSSQRRKMTRGNDVASRRLSSVGNEGRPNFKSHLKFGPLTK